MGKVNLAAILDKKPEEIERPPLLPTGGYTWVITKPGTFDTMGQDGKFETVTFDCKVAAAGEDVDPDDLREYEEKAGSVTNATSRVRFMFDTEDELRFVQTENNIKRFLQDHVKCWDDGQGLRQAITDAQGNQFFGVIRHRPDKNDPEIVYAEIGKTMAVDD